MEMQLDINILLLSIGIPDGHKNNNQWFQILLRDYTVNMEKSLNDDAAH